MSLIVSGVAVQARQSTLAGTVSILCSLAGRYGYSAELVQLSRVRQNFPLQRLWCCTVPAARLKFEGRFQCYRHLEGLFALMLLYAPKGRGPVWASFTVNAPRYLPCNCPGTGLKSPHTPRPHSSAAHTGFYVQIKKTGVCNYIIKYTIKGVVS
jgi:hypothetical protein